MSLIKVILGCAMVGILMVALVQAQPEEDKTSSDHSSGSNSTSYQASGINDAFLDWTFSIELDDPSFVDLEYGILPEQHFGPHCPNVDFLRKHLMEFGTTSDNAKDFSRIFRYGDDWMINHVLAGQSAFHMDEDQYCVNSDLLPVFMVKKELNGEITSRLVGNACRLYHSVDRGHMIKKLLCRVEEEELQLSTGKALFTKMANLLSGRED